MLACLSFGMVSDTNGTNGKNDTNDNNVTNDINGTNDTKDNNGTNDTNYANGTNNTNNTPVTGQHRRTSRRHPTARSFSGCQGIPDNSTDNC
jgi:hypothetical protein